MLFKLVAAEWSCNMAELLSVQLLFRMIDWNIQNDVNNKGYLKVLLYFATYEPGQCRNAGHFDLCTYISNSCNQSKDFANSILVTRNDYWLQLIEIYYIFYLCVCICAKKDALKHWAIILDLKSLITVVCSQSKLQGNIYVCMYIPTYMSKDTKQTNKEAESEMSTLSLCLSLKLFQAKEMSHSIAL